MTRIIPRRALAAALGALLCSSACALGTLVDEINSQGGDECNEGNNNGGNNGGGDGGDHFSGGQDGGGTFNGGQDGGGNFNGGGDGGGNFNGGGNNNGGNNKCNKNGNGNGDGGNNNGSVRIDNVQPLQVHPGDSLTISGSGFNGSPISVETDVGGCLVTSTQSNEIHCQTPTDIQQNDYGRMIGLSVMTPNGSARREAAFSFIAGAPEITSLEPQRLRWGDELTIHGSHLQQPGLQLMFGNQQAQPRQVSDNQIVVVVPKYAPRGPVSLSYQGGQLNSTQSLDILQVAILGLSTWRASYLDPVTVTGYGFHQGVQVLIGQTPVDLIAAPVQSESFTFRVPTTATTGTLTVALSEGEDTTSQTLQVDAKNVVTGSDLSTEGQRHTSAALTAFASQSEHVLNGWLLFKTGPNSGHVGTLNFLLDSQTFFTSESFPNATGQEFVLVQ